MSRYIDAEWIRNVYAEFEHYDNRNDWATPIANVLAVIDDAPSIDIVRCGECKWEWTMKCPPHRMGLIHDESDYCSYGIRRADDE